MNDETYEALKHLYIIALEYKGELKLKKRLAYDEKWELATLTRDIDKIKGWIEETAKEHDELWLFTGLSMHIMNVLKLNK